MSEFTNLFVDFIGNILNLFKLLFEYILNGLQFLVSSFSIIPDYIFTTFSSMPNFFQIGLGAILGLVIGIVLLKIVSIIFLQGG